MYQKFYQAFLFLYNTILLFTGRAKTEAIQESKDYTDLKSTDAYERAVVAAGEKADVAKNQAIEAAAQDATSKADAAQSAAITAAGTLASEAETRAVATSKTETTAQVGVAKTELQQYAQTKANAAQTSANSASNNYTDIKFNELISQIQQLTSFQNEDINMSMIGESGSMDLANLLSKLLAGTATAQAGKFTDNKGNFVEINLGTGQSLTITDFPKQGGGTESITLTNDDTLFLQLVNGAVTVAVAQKDGVVARVVSLEGRMLSIENNFATHVTENETSFNAVNTRFSTIEGELAGFLQYAHNDMSARGLTPPALPAWAA